MFTIDHNQLWLIVKMLTTIFLFYFKKKVLWNNPRQSVEITWMRETLVSHEYRMEVMDHMDPFFYVKYILKLLYLKFFSFLLIWLCHACCFFLFFFFWFVVLLVYVGIIETKISKTKWYFVFIFIFRFLFLFL